MEKQRNNKTVILLMAGLLFCCWGLANAATGQDWASPGQDGYYGEFDSHHGESSSESFIETTSSAATSSRLVFSELVVPTMKTTAEQNRLAAAGGVRTFGGALRGEWVEKAGDENGLITGFSLGLAYDEDNYTVGVILPYDYLDFDSYRANRLGPILYGQYHLGLTDSLEATLTANANYLFTDLRISEAEDINTYGGGLSLGVRYSQEIFEIGVGGSYQYNQVDLDIEDDDQHLVKAGANIGVRITDNQVINLFGTWNYDFTDYEVDLVDDEYFEIGTEYRANFTETWGMNVGYRKVADLEDYDSDMVYLGSSWQF